MNLSINFVTIFYKCRMQIFITRLLPFYRFRKYTDPGMARYGDPGYRRLKTF